jgi:hypothetical protein
MTERRLYLDMVRILKIRHHLISGYAIVIEPRLKLVEQTGSCFPEFCCFPLCVAARVMVE